MGRGFDITFVGWGQNAMGRGFDIPWIGGSKYYGGSIYHTYSIKWVNIQLMKIYPEVNISWGSIYHRTPVGSFTHPSACVGFCTSGPQSGGNGKLHCVWAPEIFPVCPDVD